MLVKKGLIVNIGKEKTGVGNYVKLIMKYSRFNYDLLNISLFKNSEASDYPQSCSGETYFLSADSNNIAINLFKVFTGLFRKRVSRFISNLDENYNFILLSQQDLIFLASVFHTKFSSKIAVTVHDAGIFKFKMHPFRIFLNYNFKKLEYEDFISIMYDSQKTKEDIKNIIKGINERGKIVELTVDTSNYIKRDKLECRKILGLPIETPIVLNVGKDGYVKNIKTMFRSLSRIKVNNFLFIRVGELNHSKKIYDSLDRETKKKIVILDKVNDDILPLYYNAADVFVFPSIKEGFGLELIEAILSGNIVITTYSPPMNDITKEFGLYVHNPFDFIELSQIVSEALTLKDTDIKPNDEWIHRFSVKRFIKEVEECLLPTETPPS